MIDAHRGTLANSQIHQTKTWESRKNLNRRNSGKWQDSHVEKESAKFLTLSSWAQYTVHKIHKEYIVNVLNLDLITQDEYNLNSKDKPAIAKQFWSYAKSKLRDTTGVALKHIEGVLVSCAKGKTNNRNYQYVTIFSKEEGEIPSKGASPHPVIIEPRH